MTRRQLWLVVWLAVLWANGIGTGDTDGWLPTWLSLITSGYAAGYIYSHFIDGWK